MVLIKIFFKNPLSLFTALQHLQHMASKHQSLLNQDNGSHRRTLRTVIKHCKKTLGKFSAILQKYDALPEGKSSLKKSSQQLKFGNDEMLELNSIRLELSAHTGAINLFLNEVEVESLGTMMQYLHTHGKKLRKLQGAIDRISPSVPASTEEQSEWTYYSGDDKK